jgi:hypothetical protein
VKPLDHWSRGGIWTYGTCQTGRGPENWGIQDDVNMVVDFTKFGETKEENVENVKGFTRLK